MRLLPARLRALPRRRLVPVLTAVVAVLAVVAAGAAEYTARAVIRDRIARAAPALGDDVTVSTAGDWALWGLARRTIPSLRVGSDDAAFGPLPRVGVRLRLDGVRLAGEPAVSGSRAQVTVPTESLAAALRAAAPSVQVSGVATDPARGTVLAGVGPGGAGLLTLRPVLADGKVTFTVESLTVFGRSVPVGRLGAGGGFGVDGPGPRTGTPKEYPLGLRATSLRVRPDGLHVDLAGGPSRLPAA
ncbi:DUF2993 domain-containing protein [Streptomyces sp. NPDC059442]|uniref:LmeA family phospholipid-binding protein n=1 Tax=Streptomyces sp. NPDC059442 TaxID=3346830 RepID=UPI00368ECD65